MPLGALLSPFAALTCALRARSMGLSAGRYAAIGALYSTLLFLPFCYLVLRMYDKTVSSAFVRAGYFILYTVWFLTSIVGTSVAAFFTGLTAFGTDHSAGTVAALGGDPLVVPTAVGAAVFCTLIILLCANTAAWILSMTGLVRFHKNSAQNSGILPHRAYIMPFAYALGWIIAGVIGLLAMGMLFR